MFKRGVLIIILLALLVTPVFYAKATDLGGSWAQATAFITKEFGLDIVARVITRNLLNKMVSGLITKIQTGGEGGKPTFVQNWRNFQTDSQYRGEDVFRSILAGTKLCGYLDKDIKGMFGVKSTQPKIPLGQNLRVDNFDPFKLRASCTMPSNFNIQNYQKDFSGNGGWNAWSRMLEPQNNYYGTLFGSLDEAARQRNIEAQAGAQEAQAGSGYTSIRDGCQDQFAGTGQAGPTQPSQARCTFMGKVFTPADLLGKTAASTIDKDLEWLVSSDELSEVIMNIVQASINRLTNLATTKTSNDYNNSPPASDEETDSFNQCSSACNGVQQCLLSCAQGTSDLIPDLATPIPPGGGLTCADVPSAQSCSASNQANVVQQIKDDLMAQNISIIGLCGAFEITKRVACAVGAGLLSTNHSGNCNGFAAGNIAYPDGSEVDILGDEGGSNNPQWNPGTDNPEPAVFYTPANCP